MFAELSPSLCACNIPREAVYIRVEMILRNADCSEQVAWIGWTLVISWEGIFWAKLVDKSRGGFWSSEGGTFLRNVRNRSPSTQRHIPEHRNPRLHRSENLGTRRSEDCPTSGWFFSFPLPPSPPPRLDLALVKRNKWQYIVAHCGWSAIRSAFVLRPSQWT